jgi:hypothetical protein
MQGVAASKKTLKEILATLRQLPGRAASLKPWGLCAAALKGILISDDPRFLRQYLARSELFELLCKGLSHGLQLLVADTAGSTAAPPSSTLTPQAAAAPTPDAAAATATESASRAAPIAAAAAAAEEEEEEVPDHLDLGALTLLALALKQCVQLAGDQDSDRMLAFIDSSGKLFGDILLALSVQGSDCSKLLLS